MILMRHGQSHFNVVYGATRRDPGIRDPGLTEKGQAQVAAAAAHPGSGSLHPDRSKPSPPRESHSLPRRP